MQILELIYAKTSLGECICIEAHETDINDNDKGGEERGTSIYVASLSISSRIII